jgi:hypothetical protein
VGRIAARRAARKTLCEIAETLNAEGFHPPKRSPRFTKEIWFIRRKRIVA